MSQADPAATTPTDIATTALYEAGAVSLGQTPLAEYVQEALVRLQWMVQQWAVQRFLVYSLVSKGVETTGQFTYSVGPGGDFDTGTGSQRPPAIQSGFLRQPVASGGIPVDLDITIMKSREDYNRVRLKHLVSQTLSVYYEETYPLGTVYPWPVPTSNIYELWLSWLAPLPNNLATEPTQNFVLPYEYYNTMIYNLAMRLRGKYRIPTFPGDPLPVMAKDSLQTLRDANFQIPQLAMPGELVPRGMYNIFGDYNA